MAEYVLNRSLRRPQDRLTKILGHRKNRNIVRCAPIFNSVIPTGVRRSPLGSSDGVEEPACSLPKQSSRVFVKLVFSVAAFGAIVLGTVTTAFAQKASKSQSDARELLSNITNSLANGSVKTIDILHIPDRILTRAAVTPENLERWFDFRITINKVPEWSGREEFVDVLRSTGMAPESRMPDLRSAIIFNGPDGQRVGALYFGRYYGRYPGQFGGAEGAIGNTPVKFNGSLSKWLKDMMPSQLQ